MSADVLDLRLFWASAPSSLVSESSLCAVPVGASSVEGAELLGVGVGRAEGGERWLEFGGPVAEFLAEETPGDVGDGVEHVLGLAFAAGGRNDAPVVAFNGLEFGDRLPVLGGV